MAVRGEEVASSIDAHVREEIEKMVSEIRSSIEDVRAVVDSQLKAALQSVQADVKSITFLPHIQKSIADLSDGAVEAPAPAAPAAADGKRLRDAIQAVERGKSQVDILNALLEQCLQFGSRAALLIVRGETFSGWKGLGFGAHGGNDEAVKRFNAAPGLIPELDRVLRDEQVITWDGRNLATRLGVSAGSKAILIPMVIKDKVAAAVFVDAIEADVARLEPASIESLVFTTGLLVDTLAIRKKIPSPSLNEASEPTLTRQSPPTLTSATPTPTHAAPRAVPSPTPQRPVPAVPSSPAPAAQAVPTKTSSETVAITAQQMREMITSASAGGPGFNVPSAEDLSVPGAAKPAAAPPPAAPVAALDKEERAASTQYVPPSGATRGGAFGGPQSEEAKKHDEARRFARLLVSEIKLYNESKVDQGRKNGDLYERLKEDIDRSRQMYDERIAEDVRKSSNYFYDELVRILADGKADALGL
jgi:hypothetical protein